MTETQSRTESLEQFDARIGGDNVIGQWTFEPMLDAGGRVAGRRWAALHRRYAATDDLPAGTGRQTTPLTAGARTTTSTGQTGVIT